MSRDRAAEVSLVVYHSPENYGNFGWDVNYKRKIPEIKGTSRTGSSKILPEIPNGKCVYHLQFATQRLFYIFIVSRFSIS